MKLFLARHGEDEDNRDNVFNGRRNTPLTLRGIRQATDLANRMKAEGLDFSAVYSSPLLRAFHTAEIISTGSGQPAPRVLDTLVERHMGTLTGVAVKDAPTVYIGKTVEIKNKTYFVTPEGGESFTDLMSRSKKLLDMLHAEHTDKNVLLVSHRMLLTMLCAEFYGLTWQYAITEYYFENGELFFASKENGLKKCFPSN